MDIDPLLIQKAIIAYNKNIPFTGHKSEYRVHYDALRSAAEVLYKEIHALFESEATRLMAEISALSRRLEMRKDQHLDE